MCIRDRPQAGRRVIFGHSMGGAVAVALASQLRHGRDYGALILESSFTRMPDVAAQAGFWGRLAASITSLEFDALSRVGRIDAPLLMLHGSADTVSYTHLDVYKRQPRTPAAPPSGAAPRRSRSSPTLSLIHI